MSDRNVNRCFLAVKEEATEGTDPVPTMDSNGISQLVEPFAPDVDYVFQNPRPRQARGGIIEAARPLAPSGRVGVWNYAVHGRGSRGGVVYSATPGTTGSLELDPEFLAAGCSVTYSGGAGAEIVTVRPAATALKAATAYFWQDGTLYKLLAAKNEIAVEIDAGGPVRFAITKTGLYQALTAVGIPTPLAASLGQTLPPICENVSVSLDFGGGAGTTAIVRSFRMAFGNRVVQRPSFGGASGLAPHKIRFREPTWSMVVEQPVAGVGPPLYDFETFLASPVPGTISFTIGAVQYNRIVFTLHPVITSVKKQDDNGTAMVELSGTLHSSDGVALDAFEIKFT